MANLTVEQRTVLELFQNKRTEFLIPDYQRPYAWGEEECQTLWDDIFTFAFPDNDCDKFNSDDEYFLGPIVTFKNKDGKLEVIDGQQRLTTLLLLLRAFYPRFKEMKDEPSQETYKNIEVCIWKKPEFGLDTSKLKITSEVASDDAKEDFFEILKTGKIGDDKKSMYAKNFRFFVKLIDEFTAKFSAYLPHFATRLMKNCILLPIEAESQDTALRIFSTLNDRGKPLSDSDIFKAQFYKFYSELDRKNEFIKRWKRLEEICAKIFRPVSGTPMDELFSRYMYYVRATQGNKESTIEGLRKFYYKDDYALLKSEETFNNLETLADFWNDVYNQNENRFSEKILKKLFVLMYAPNGMWTYLVSAYFLTNRSYKELLDIAPFEAFLDKITGFIWAYSVTNPGVYRLRTPVYAEMIGIVNGGPTTFGDYKFDVESVRTEFENYSFRNQRPITRSMLMWWAFQDEKQELLSAATIFEIEHIYPRNRQDMEKSLKDSGSLESLGNKAVLEKKINIRASDYKFADKKKYYEGFVNSRGQSKGGTDIAELVRLAESKIDFTEADIHKRESDIIEAFISFLKANDLTK